MNWASPSNREGSPYAAAGWSAASLVLDGRHRSGGARRGAEAPRDAAAPRGAGAGASYLINRNFSIDAGYRYSKLWSDDNEEEFDRNVVRIGVTARL